MKKITGKVVSLVLALALVVTSFSATFAFAADTKVSKGTVTVTPTPDTAIVLAAGQTTAGTGVTLPTLALSFTDNDGVKWLGATTPASPTPTWTIGNTGLAAFDSNINPKTIKNVAKSATGTTTLTATYKNVTFTTADGSSSVTVPSASATITVKVVKVGAASPTLTTWEPTAVYAVGDDGAPVKGKDLPLQVTLAVNDAPTYAVYALTADTTTGEVAYSKMTGDVKFTSTDVNTVNIDAAGKVTAQTATAVKISSSQVKAVSVADTTKLFNTANLTVKRIYTVTAGTIASSTTYGQGGKAVINNYDVTGYDINVDTSLALTGGSVGTITGGAITVTGGSATKIDADSAEVTAASIGSIKTSAATTIHAKANVGTIEALGVTADGGKTGNITSTGAVSVASATTGVILAKGQAVTVDSSNVGNITGAAVDVTATKKTDDDKATPIQSTVGNIAASGAVAVGSTSDVANVTVGSVASDVSITLDQGTDVTTKVGNVVGKAKAKSTDALVTTLTVNGGSYSVGSLANFLTADIAAGAELKSSSALAMSTLTVNGKISVPSAELDSLLGTGTITVPAGKLVVKAMPSNATLNATGDIKVGTVLFKSVSGAKSVFVTPGITLTEIDNRDNTYSYAVEKIEFAGLSISETATKLAKGYKDTLTLSSIPSSTKIPAGYKVKWEIEEGKNVKLTTSADGLSAVIEATDWSDLNFNNSNNVVVKAYLVDAAGFQVWTYGNEVTCAVTVIEKPDTSYKSDTNKDVAVSTKYQFKITSLNGKAPTFAVGNSKVFTSALTKTIGSDYYYTITAVGKVGESAGIYVNGEARLVVATVKANFVSDTNKALTVKGAYTVQITSATAPTFGVGTAGVFNAVFVSKTGDKYLYKLTSVGKVGTQAGIYVNGSKVFVATVG